MPSNGAFATFNFDGREAIGRRIDEYNAYLIKRMKYIGECCVKEARQSGSYGDVTGNLRSSIGYVILKDGIPVEQGRPRKYKDGAEGAGAAQALLDALRGEYPKGIVLIVCAGMKYAAYVEEIHHKDVLTSAEHLANELIRRLIAKLT